MVSSAHPPVRKPPPRPLMVYDGDCGFCRKWIGRWRHLTGDRVDYEPYQKVSEDYPEIPLADFKKAVQLILPDGRVFQGAQAVFEGLAPVGTLKWLAWIYGHFPGFALVSEWAYAFVASHRQFFSSADSCGLSSADEEPQYFFSRWLFLKILALAYLTAFGSLWPQVDGLIGEKGILPAASFLGAAREQLGPSAFWFFPSLCWADAGNGFLHFLCAGGAALSLLLFFGLAPALCLALLWFFYLSLVSVGGDFLSFQWDNLLLEAGLLALFAAPLQLRFQRGDGRRPMPRAVLFLLQWLLFRLMFSSGVCKLSSGDTAWRNLTALEYHYQTQPLPTPLAWFMNQLPDWFQKFSCLYMFGVELIVPFLIFGPRRLRPAAFLLLVSLQILILLTGNYCFFNLLTLGLCLFALEDAAWPGWFKNWWEGKSARAHGKAPVGRWPSWVIGTFAALAIYMTVFQMTYTMGFRAPWPSWMTGIYQALDPLRSFNSYGLFAVMTTTRPEIAVEGSDDGVQWKAYGFKWKPGDLKKSPGYVAPYQPRLDWQMWFAALGSLQQNPWFGNFLVRLLQGSQDVLGLMGYNPFPGRPPQFIRAEVYDYRFTTFTEKAETGNWWKAEDRGPYTRPFSLQQLGLGTKN